LTAVALVACNGSDDVAAPPLPQRFLTAADAPGTKPDPVEERQTAAGLDEFVATFGPHLIDPDTEEMTTVFKDGGFKRAGSDVRFFGDKHAPHAPHLFDTFYELESEDGARSALDWLEADSMKPCPNSCAVRISNFDVDDIPGARGTHRIATAKEIKALGTEDEHPSDDYWVGFTVGSIVYTVLLQGPQDLSLRSKRKRSQAPTTIGLPAPRGADRTPPLARQVGPTHGLTRNENTSF
jgi:hypothetical protein